MSSRHILFVIGAHVLQSKTAVGGEFADPSLNPAKVRSAAEEQYAKLIEIPPDQWRFLRGVYAMNAEAPPGLPRGDYAVLAQGSGDSDSLLFFVDHGELGSPMHAPPALLSLMERQRCLT